MLAKKILTSPDTKAALFALLVVLAEVFLAETRKQER